MNKQQKNRFLASLRYQYGNRAREQSKELFNKTLEDLNTTKEFNKLFKELET